MESNTNKKVIEKCCEKCYGRQGTTAGGGIFCSDSTCPCHTPSKQEEKCSECQFEEGHSQACSKYESGKPFESSEKKCKECYQIMETGYGECLEHNPSSPQPSSWEKEFDERFTWERNPEGRGFLFDNVGQQTVDEVIMKSYISNLLLQAQTEEKKEILKQVKDKLLKKSRETDYADRTEYDEAYEIVEKVINLINK